MFLSLGICPACDAPAAAAERSELHLGSGEFEGSCKGSYKGSRGVWRFRDEVWAFSVQGFRDLGV